MIENKDLKELQDMAEVLKALAHPVRLCIARGLWRNGSCNVTHMQNCLEAPQSTVSQHVGKLRQAGIIEGQRKGLEITYSIKDKRIEKLLSCLFSTEEKQEK